MSDKIVASAGGIGAYSRLGLKTDPSLEIIRVGDFEIYGLDLPPRYPWFLHKIFLRVVTFVVSSQVLGG